MLHLGLPLPVKRLLCNFLKDQTAQIRIGSHIGHAFHLVTSVPKGSVLSPTLYIIFTKDCLPAISGLNIQYTDDMLQVVPYPG